MKTIDDIRQPVEAEFEIFEHRFAQALQSDINVLKDIYEHTLANKGKRVRPLLTLLSGRLCGKINDKTYDIASVLEILHTASLMHDDVIDDTHQRRGQQSVNDKWTNKLAILSGDYMLGIAMKMLVQLRNVRLQQLVCELVQRLSKGEVLELHHDSSMWIDETQYFDIIYNKTASLFATCTEAGAISVGATGYQATALRRFGEELGLCFQLQDDILDWSDGEQLGKPTMNDIRDHKVTLPLIISLNRAEEEECALLKKRIENEPFDWSLENDIKSFVLRYDGIRYAQKKIEEHRHKAKLHLTAFHPITPAYEALLNMLDFTTQRTY